MLTENSCGAVVFLRGAEVRYLVLHYEAGHWDFVKGNVEPGESERETVLRELKEETGIVDAKFIDGFREKISYFYRRQGLTVYKEVVFLLMEAYTEKVTLSFEHIGYEWLRYQEALNRLTFKNARNVLKKANEFLKANGLIF
jgi:bis(5'-nucleosidyl)-tetraphosphatase